MDNLVLIPYTAIYEGGIISGSIKYRFLYGEIYLMSSYKP